MLGVQLACSRWVSAGCWVLQAAVKLCAGISSSGSEAATWYAGLWASGYTAGLVVKAVGQGRGQGVGRLGTRGQSVLVNVRLGMEPWSRLELGHGKWQPRWTLGTQLVPD